MSLLEKEWRNIVRWSCTMDVFFTLPSILRRQVEKLKCLRTSTGWMFHFCVDIKTWKWFSCYIFLRGLACQIVSIGIAEFQWQIIGKNLLHVDRKSLKSPKSWKKFGNSTRRFSKIFPIFWLLQDEKAATFLDILTLVRVWTNKRFSSCVKMSPLFCAVVSCNTAKGFKNFHALQILQNRHYKIFGKSQKSVKSRKSLRYEILLIFETSETL